MYGGTTVGMVGGSSGRTVQVCRVRKVCTKSKIYPGSTASRIVDTVTPYVLASSTLHLMK